MKRGALIVALVSGVLLTSVLVGVASAADVEKATTLTIGRSPSGQVDPGDRVLVFGRLRPNACAEDQTIRLFEVVPGPNNLLKTDTTDADGEYRFRLRPDDDMIVLAKFRGSVDSTYGDSLTCLKSKSDRLHINVVG